MSTNRADFRRRLLANEPLIGTFVKTPSVDIVEVLAMSGMDFMCLDAEHGAIDRRSMDAPLAIARALGFPAVVRVAMAAPDAILQALDCGAIGVLVPHVFSVERAHDVARWAHFGEGGRGYAGSTRWAGFAGTSIPDNLKRDREETVVMAQIEDAGALPVVDQIAKVDGIDSLFVGPADFAVALGAPGPTDAKVIGAYDKVIAAARAANKNVSTFAGTPEIAKDLRARGVSAFLINSDQGLMLTAARNTVAAMR